MGGQAVFVECEPHHEVIILQGGYPQDGSCSKCFKNGRLIGSPRKREISEAEAKKIIRERNGGRSDGGNGRSNSGGCTCGDCTECLDRMYGAAQVTDRAPTSGGGSSYGRSYNTSPPSDYGRSYGGQGEPEAYSRGQALDMQNDVYDKKLMCRNCEADTIGRNQIKFSKTNNPADICPNGRSPYRGRKKDDHSWLSEKVWLERYGRRRLAEDNVNPLTAFCAWALMLLIVVVVYTLTKMGKRSAMQRRHLSKTQVAF